MGIKHTPAPWVCLEGDKRVYSSAGVICQRFTGATAQPANKNWRANSKLIAAAPELLDALEELLAATQHLDQCHQATADKARVAIAKAKGEEQ